MTHVVTFATRKFDISQETPNDINPIAGQGLLKWLCAKLASDGHACTEPATEDWGWYIEITIGASAYLVGASGEPEPPAQDVDWTIQIHKHRTLKDKILGKNKMTADDPLSALIERHVRSEADFQNIVVNKAG